MLELHWDTLNHLTKDELLSGACLQGGLRHYEWNEIDRWLQQLIIDSLERRSHSTTTIL